MARLLLKDLRPGADYLVQLRAVDDDSFSEWSRLFPLDVTSDTTPPDTPDWSVNDWVVDGDSFVASWEPINLSLEQNTDFAFYEIEVSNGITTVIKNVGGNTTYTLLFNENRAIFGNPSATVTARVRSVDRVGNRSPWTTTESATNPPPDAPDSISVTSLYDAVDVSWSPGSLVGDAESFVLYFSTTSSTSGFVEIYEGQGSSLTHPTTQFVTDHWYRVLVKDKFGSVSPFVTSSAVRPKSTFSLDTDPPDNATSFDGTPGFDSDQQRAYIDFAWTASATPGDVRAYEIRWSSDGSNWKYESVPDTETGFVLPNLSPSVNYYASIRSVDAAGNYSAWLNAQTYPIISAGDTVAPSTPEAPTVVGDSQQIQVSISGNKAAGGAMETDVKHYEVFASQSSGFTTYDSTTMVGTVDNGPVIIGSFHLPTEDTDGNWYVKIRAVDHSGNTSPASAQATSTVGLIDTAHINNLAVTSAKINDLAANKITAGSGIINDLEIKSTLTVGDGTTPGVIQSDEYVSSGGLAGYRLSDDGLVIKTGDIEAEALKVQSGSNMIPPEYASFEGNIESYQNLLVHSGVGGSTGNAEVTTEQGKFGIQSLKVSLAAGTSYLVSLEGNAEYRTPVSEGTPVIISFYAKTPAASGNKSVGLLKESNVDAGENSVGLSQSTFSVSDTGNWQRFYAIYTPQVGATGIFLLLSNDTAGDVYFDGIQVEHKLGSLSAPSPWSPSSVTKITGGLITTGAIRSSAGAVDAAGNPIVGVPAWSIDTEGDANFGDILIRGSVTVGLNGSEPPAPDDASETDDLTGVSIIKSYNYVPGITGWAIKSNGRAEFRQLEINSIADDAITSISANKVTTGTVESKISIAGEFITQESEEIFIIGKKRLANVATMTTLGLHGRQVGDRVKVRLDQDIAVDNTFDTAGESYVEVIAVTDDTFSYANTGPDVTGTTHDGFSTAHFNGRFATLDPFGLTLYNNAGDEKMVDITTALGEQSFFSGTVEAGTLVSKDSFSMRGSNNQLSSGSELIINAGIRAPSATFADVNNWETILFESFEDPYHRQGLFYDSANSQFITTETKDDGTGYALIINLNGTLGDSIQIEDWPFGIVKIGGVFYGLHAQEVGDEIYDWIIVEYSTAGTGLDSVANTWNYNERLHSTFNVPLSTWRWNGKYTKGTGADGIGNVPGIGTDGTNLYVGRTNNNFKVVVSWYNTSGSRLGIVETDATAGGKSRILARGVGYINYYSYENVPDLTVGNADFGALRIVIPNNQKRIFQVADATGALYGTQAFPYAYGSLTAGLVWNGSQFHSISASGVNSIDSYSDAWAGSTIDTVYYRATWQDVSGPYETNKSVEDSFFPKRRARVRLSTEARPDAVDKANFWFSQTSGGTTYLESNPNNSSVFLLTDTPAFSGTSATGAPFPENSPAKIVSSAASDLYPNEAKFEIRADGFFRTDVVRIESTRDASTNSNNAPPLLIGDPDGNHLRIDGNEIISMDSDTAPGFIGINKDGGAVTIGSTATGDNTIIRGSSLTLVGGSSNITLGSGGDIDFNAAGHDVDISTGSGGRFRYIDYPNTTSGSGNVHMASGGQFFRVSSSSVNKTNITGVNHTLSTLLSLEPHFYTSLLPFDDPAKVTAGFMADEADALGLSEWVEYNEEGEPISFSYPAWTAALQKICREQQVIIEKLEIDIENIKNGIL